MRSPAGGFDRYVGGEGGRQVAEEIVAEYYRDAPQQLRVEGRTVEDVVDIAAVAVQLAREPYYVVPFRLPVEDLADKVPHMHHLLAGSLPAVGGEGIGAPFMVVWCLYGWMVENGLGRLR